MAQKKTRKKKRKPATTTSGGAPTPSGGILQSMRASVRRAAGVDDSKEKPSLLSNVIWGLIFAAVLGFAIYRWFFQSPATTPPPSRETTAEERPEPTKQEAPEPTKREPAPTPP